MNLFPGKRGRQEGPPAQRAVGRHQDPEEEAVVRFVLKVAGFGSAVDSAVGKKVLRRAPRGTSPDSLDRKRQTVAASSCA